MAMSKNDTQDNVEACYRCEHTYVSQLMALRSEISRLDSDYHRAYLESDAMGMIQATIRKAEAELTIGQIRNEMQAMTQQEVRAKYEERRLAEESAYLKGEEVQADRVLNDAREGHGGWFEGREAAVDQMADKARKARREGKTMPFPVWGTPDVEPEENVETLQSYDPRSHVEEEEPEPYRVPPATADKMLEIWYLYQTVGEIKTAKIMESVGGDGSPYEALAASRYVEDTPGFNREIVMFGQATRGEHDPWSRWYGRWPDNRTLAQTMYETFRAALAQRLHVEPFRILTTPIYTPDHLDYADRANPNDPVSRNKKWSERLREKRMMT